MFRENPYIFVIIFPHQEKSISNILVGSTLVGRDHLVDDRPNLVGESHDTRLEDLGGICEIPDIAKSIDAHDLLSRE